MFVDQVRLHIKAGDGGNGAVAFRREKFVPRGGPSGGDGGRGGHVILRAHPKLGTLYDLRHRPNLAAGRGGDGGSKDCHGADGESLVIDVPLGTIVTDKNGNEQLADLTEPHQEWIAARGGRGGFGNAHFATSTNKTPREARPGEPGEEHVIVLELKLIADVGLVGLPNAGKSTLLASLTAATPKIAAYPFTTLHPNLGVIGYDDHTSLTIADIPGLIEGASRGVGLGDRFLRHIERTRMLAHLIGDESGRLDAEEALYKYDLVRQELTAYSPRLLDKDELVLLSKIDLADPDDLEETCRLFRARGIEPLCVSAATGEGLDRLKAVLHERATQHTEGSPSDGHEGMSSP